MALIEGALCEISDVSRQLDKTLTSEQESLIENIINFVSKYAENYIGRNIKARSSDITEYIDIDNEQQIITLKNFPIQSITSVVEDGETLTEGENNDYLEYDKLGELYKNSSYWVQGRKKVVVTYKGGYATIPEDLKQWCINLSVNMYNEKELGNIKSEKVGDLSVSYEKGMNQLIGYNKMLNNVLDLYKSNIYF